MDQDLEVAAGWRRVRDLQLDALDGDQPLDLGDPGKRRVWTLIDESGTARDVRAERPGEGSVRREDLDRVTSALDRLDADKRAMIMLRVNEGLSYDDIARHLGVPVGTVMSRLNRARLALLEELGESEDAASGRPSEFNIHKFRDASR